jgi:NADH-quinone oxidoreductase subunit N
MNWSDFNWMAILPETIIFLTAVVLLIVEMIFRSEHNRKVFATLTLVGIVGAMAAIVSIWNLNTTEFFGMFSVDMTANLLKMVLLIMTGLVIFGTINAETKIGDSEFYSLILFSVFGTMSLASSSDLIMLFISLEITVIPAYILTASKRTPRSSEAALKYFLLGIIASVVLLYGMTLLYGLSGETNFSAIAAKLNSGTIEPAIVVAMIMIIVGLGFKVAAVPFHFWVPDVYEGSPIPVAAYLATGPKAGGFAAIIHLFPLALASTTKAWAAAFAALAVLSMIVGNLSALSQKHVRRMLGYSAVAHTGYLLVGLATATDAAYTALIFYFFVYSLAALGAFLVVFATTEKGVGENVFDFLGMYKRSPMLAIAMAVFMFSLVGIPPFAGFMGKFFLFKAAVASKLVWLTIVGVLNSVVSLAYYITVVRHMWFLKPEGEGAAHVSVSAPLYVSIVAILLAIVVFGLFPNSLNSVIKF